MFSLNVRVEKNATIPPGNFSGIVADVVKRETLVFLYILSVFRLDLDVFPSRFCNKTKETLAFF
jgi:hypothetical protein